MLAHIVIFIIVLFLYLHITEQYKKGENMEVYEMDYLDNPQLQEVCDIKQPIVFDSPPNPFFEKMRNTINVHYGSYEVCVKDSSDYENGSMESVDNIVLPFQSTQNLFLTDTQGHYFSEDNEAFLEETGLHLAYRELDTFLKPSFVVNTKEDLWFGSKGSRTPLRYHTTYRRFLCVVSGRVHFKMTPWKSTKYLNPVKDYEHYDFRSAYDPWSKEAALDGSPLQFLEAEAHAGQIVYLPPYWWYSIQYMSDEPTYICVETYHSVMNLVAHVPDLAFYYLQHQNITKKYGKSVSFATPLETVETMVSEENAAGTEKDATLELTQNLAV